MKQSTCDIVMCCKLGNLFDRPERDPFGNAKRYIEEECLITIEPNEYYMVEQFITKACIDYFSTSSDASKDLRILLENAPNKSPILIDQIITLLTLVDVRVNGNYVNGFTEEMINKSKRALHYKEDNVS